ncbi:hypothetical protein GEMRC1_012064 [Eukaryota sp. GEM-RC1]
MDLSQALQCLSGSTILIPSVSLGYSGLCCTNLLAKALPAELVDHVYSPDLVPFSRYSPNNMLESSLMLYRLRSDVFLFVQNSMPLKGKHSSFAESISTFVTINQMKPIVLGSLDISHRPDPSRTDRLFQLCDTSRWNLKLPVLDDSGRFPGGGNVHQLYKVLKSNPDHLFVFVLTESSPSFEDSVKLALTLNNCLKLDLNEEIFNSVKNVVFPEEETEIARSLYLL